MIFNLTSPVIKSKAHVPVLGEDFTYTGNCTVIDDSSAADGVQWRIKFLTSGTLTLGEDTVIDVFLVGGGGSGNGWRQSYDDLVVGGGGGYTTTVKKVELKKNTPYDIVIGAGGRISSISNVGGVSGGASSAFGYTANGGAGGDYAGGGSPRGGAGGSGGGGAGGAGGSDGSNGGGRGGNGQGTTTREFGEPNGTLYAGGGAGANRNGGAGGGGNSNSYSDSYGEANTGGGGGGVYTGVYPGRTSAGGSGIVIMRKHKEVAA